MTESCILLLEDDEAVRETVQDALRAEGYHVVAVADGLEGWKQLEAGLRPRLILLDLVMPVMDGEEFLRKTSACGEDIRAIPILVFSARSEFETPTLPGVVALMQKPIDLDAFLEAVRLHFAS